MSTIAEKLADIIAEMDRPEKSGYLEYQDHRYHTRDDLVDVLRGELAERGIAPLPDASLVEHRPTGDGGVCVVVEVEFTFVDGETGESLSVSSLGESTTGDDKGTASAMTQAVRFALLNMFLVSDGMVEAVHGESPAGGRSQDHNVTRERASNDTAPRDALRNRLEELGFADEQIASFGAYIARVEGAASFQALPPDRVADWGSTFNQVDDETARDKVLGAIGDEAA